MKLRVCDYMTQGITESDITVYPQNDIIEIANIMLDTNIDAVKLELSKVNSIISGICILSPSQGGPCAHRADQPRCQLQADFTRTWALRSAGN